MAGYGRLLQAVGEDRHQSCLGLTSREAPRELAVLGAGARWLELRGLGTAEAQALLADKQLIGDTQAWLGLVDRYGGNGLALKIVGETIQHLFDGDISAFLGYADATYGTVFGGHSPAVGCPGRTTLDRGARRTEATGRRARTD